MKRKILHPLIFIIFIFIIITILIRVLSLTNLINKDNTKIIILDNFFLDNKNDNLNYRIIDKENIFVFETEVSKKDFDRINCNIYKIILYRLAAQSYKVYFNDMLIGEVGDFGKSNSNIWNGIHYFDIDKNILKEENKIRLEVFASFEIGLLAFPIFITSSSLAVKMINWVNLFLSFHLIAIGSIMLLFLLLISLYFLAGSSKPEYLYFSISALFLSIFASGNLSIYTLPVSLFLFKRIIASSLFVCVGFFSLAVYKQFKNKANLFASMILFTSLMLMLIFIKDLSLLKRVSSGLSFLILLNIISWIYTTILNFKKSRNAKILFTLNVILLILGGYDIFFNLTKETHSYNAFSLNMPILMFFSFIIMLLVVFDYIDLQKNIAIEKEKGKILYEKSTKDQMTCCYNHQFITETLQALKEPYSIIMIDIDNFKPINDNYGHQTGDYVIKHIAKILKKNVSKTNYVGRYGGDEFIIILVD
ncbi:MAG: hypothetical protein A2Y34_15785, partial [Spirochaetes bacterium GWC1_27_15]